MERLGDTLQSIFEEIGTFSFKTINQIGIQMIEMIQKVHELGYVYNDIKPENICVGKFNKENTDH
jgi:serine/threonine protein kinase